MRRLAVFLCIFVSMATVLFAGGQKESGRNVCTAAADSGSIADGAFIDTSAFINSYAFPYKVNEQEDLSIYLLNNKVSFLTSGGTQSIVLGLRANLASFFESIDVNYVVYIQSPSFLSTERSFKVFENSLQSIMDAKTAGSRIALFSAQSGKLRFISSKADVTTALQEIAKETKVKQNLKTASLSFSAMKEDSSVNPWRFLWVTDENILQNYSDIESFKVLSGMYGTLDAGFSLLCYGNSPQWGVVNPMLDGIKGNSYYGKTYQFLENTIVTDFTQFSKPAVSKITLTISSSPWLGSGSPVTLDIGNLGAGQSIMIQRDLTIPSYETMPLAQKNENFTAAYCYISYYSHKDKKFKYTTLNVDASYTDSIDQWYAQRNPVALKYSTLSSTALALSSMSKDYKLGNYSGAFAALDLQIAKLKELDPSLNDVLIRSDVQMLEKIRSSLFKQVQSVFIIE